MVPSNGIEAKAEKLSQRARGLVRGIWYFLGVVLLCLVTGLIFVALFTNNWRKSIQDPVTLNEIFSEYYTFGVWFTCRQITIFWLGTTDVYCSQINNDLGGWIIAVQVFYTLGAVFNLFSLVISIYGIFRDITKYKKAIPSLVMWLLIVSTVFQLIGLSLYGGYGIGYDTNSTTTFQPDYSLICGSVAIGANFICIIFFLVEIALHKDQAQY